MEAIEGKLVVLRPLQESHFDQYMTMYSPLVRSLLHVQSSQSELNYLRQALAHQKLQRKFFYCIFNRLIDSLIGAIEIRNMQEYAGQLYCWINESFWGSGCFQEALGLVSERYFEENGVIYFNARVDVENRRSYEALKKCGFAPDGIFSGPHGKQYQLIRRRK